MGFAQQIAFFIEKKLCRIPLEGLGMVWQQSCSVKNQVQGVDKLGKEITLPYGK